MLTPSPTKNALVAEMVYRLRHALRPERIYLFGSHARGTATPDSDYDVLVVVSHSTLPRYRRDQEASAFLTGIGAPKDVIVLTHEEFERGRRVVTSLPATVEREGLLLYAA